MKCPICGKDVELQKKQVGADEQGAPVFHQYAVCRDCKKQWDLDKQRARKTVPDAAAPAVKPEEPHAHPEKEPKEHQEAAAAVSQKAEAVKKAVPGGGAPEKKEPEKAAPEKVSGEKKAAGKAAPEKVSGEGEVSRKAASGTSAGEGKTPRKAAPEKSAGEGKAPRKAAPEKSAEGKAPRKAAPEKSAGEGKAPRKAMPEKASGEGDLPGKAGSGKASAEGGAPRKKAAGTAAAEERPQRKQAAGEAPSDRKAPRRAADGTVPAEARTSRKAPAGASSPEKRTRKPDAQRPSGEKAGTARPASAKRPAAGTASENPAAGKHPSGKPPVKRKGPGAPVNPEAEAPAAGTPKKKAVRRGMAEADEQRYGNIPPEKVRVKKEHAVRKGYEDMLSADPNHKPAKKKKQLPEAEEQPMKKERPASANKRPVTKARLEDEYEEEDEMEYEDAEYAVARFRIPRILFGIISVLAAGFFAYGGFFAGLENIASGSTVSTGTTFLIYAICMLVSGLMLLIMQNRNTILAFILPMIFYFGAAVFTFLKRADDKMFLFCAIGGAVLGLIFLVLGIVSRNSGGYDDSDDYDDPFEDDYE